MIRIALLCSLILTACAPDGVVLEPPPPTKPVPAACTVSSPGPLDFGVVPGGAIVSADVVFEGEATGCDSFELEGNTGGYAVEALNGAQFRVTFRPRHLGDHNARLLFGGAVLQLHGAGMFPNLTATPAVLDFGDTALGCGPSMATIELRHAGGLAIETAGVQLLSAVPFSVRPSDAFVIDRPRSIDVTFAPNTIGRWSSPVTIDVRDFQPSVVVAKIEGRSVARPVLVEDFEVQPLAKDDILIVVSTAPAMGPAQAELRESLRRLLLGAESSYVDVRVAVTDADLGGLGGRFAAPGIIDRSTPDFLTRVIEATQLGTDGSPSTALLEAAYRAFMLPENASFFRPDADLSIIFVSDRDDVSPDAIATYVARVRQFAPTEVQSLSVQSIVSLDPLGCTGVAGAASSAPRQLEFTNAIGGSVSSICQREWWDYTMYESTGYTVLLGANAIDETIRVFVDGEPLPRIGEARRANWTYRAEHQAVRFPLISRPPLGSRVRVEYQSCD